MGRAGDTWLVCPHLRTASENCRECDDEDQPVSYRHVRQNDVRRARSKPLSWTPDGSVRGYAD